MLSFSSNSAVFNMKIMEFQMRTDREKFDAYNTIDFKLRGTVDWSKFPRF